MLRKVWDAFRSWKEGKQKRRAKRLAPLVNRRSRLCLEPLERRELLASLLYIGPANGNFNNANNWINETTAALVAPAANDNLDFNPSMTIGNSQGANTAAVDDEPAAFQFGNLTLAPAFTAIVTMAQREIKNNTVTLQGGTLQSAAGATVTIGGNLTWNAGTLAGTWQVGDSNDTPPLTGTMTIQLNAQIQNPQPIVLNAALTVDQGTLTWASGNIQYTNFAGLTVNANGIFTIAGDANLTMPPGVLRYLTIYNSGTINKTVGAPTSQTSLDAFITNQALGAVLQVSAGKLGATGITQSAGTILLSGGNLLRGPTLSGGNLTGVGSITGSVNNNGGTVRPGLNGSGGQLNITGNFNQTSPGTLWIDVNNATTGLGALSVTGSVSLGGNLYIYRNLTYTPNQGTLFFLTYTGSRNNTDFGSVTYYNPVWTSQGNSYTFNALPNDAQKAYTLNVIANPQGGGT